VNTSVAEHLLNGSQISVGAAATKASRKSPRSLAPVVEAETGALDQTGGAW
jgi:hypothetical protein